MKTFPIRIGTPDGLLYEGNIERVKCRSITGDVAILAEHINYVTALGMGEAFIRLEDGTERHAACIGGMLSVMDGSCHLLATTWEWKEDIDKERAERAKEKAEAILKTEGLSDKDFALATAKLNRALVRLSVKE
jgi:F-type H+-transporting ATPase subunit epsilon